MMLIEVNVLARANLRCQNAYAHPRNEIPQQTRVAICSVIFDAGVGSNRSNPSAVSTLSS